MTKVSMTVNGKTVSGEVEGRTLLSAFLREGLALTGTHIGCDTTQCGACTVHVDGAPVRSCSLPVDSLGASKIVTIEGIGAGAVGKKVQAAWTELDVAQCGYCQAGQIMSATALLTANAKPTDADIDDAMSGNICRCATYTRIRAAIKLASGQKTEA